MAEDDVDYEEFDEEQPKLRPFWSGTISFGLVSVPVDLYPAVRSKRGKNSWTVSTQAGATCGRRFWWTLALGSPVTPLGNESNWVQ